MKRVLVLASVASMIDQFNMPNIRILQKLGYEVDVACNFIEGSTCSDEKIEQLKSKLSSMNIRCFQIDFARNITNMQKNIKAYWQVLNLVNKNDYIFVHCHSPIGGVIGRIICRKKHLKVIYTAHGFHFFEGGPKKSWIIFYPIEKFFSKYTDVLITINNEDYLLAKNKFKMKRLEKIPGVGVDTKKFINCNISKNRKRKELGIPDDAFVLLSVGELSSRKNQQVVLDALFEMNDKHVFYILAGKGELYDSYNKQIKNYGLEENILLLGPRSDINELCIASDVFVHPSVREGLGIAPLEGMAAGLPLISSYVNGIRDYTEDGITGCCIDDPLDIKEMRQAIEKMKYDSEFRASCSINNKKISDKYSLEKSIDKTEEIYKTLN